MKKVNTKERARERELRVLEQWRQNDVFQKSVENRVGNPPFVFYEGPPTANGLPHIGHMLGRVIKDFIGRYKTMRGYKVVRKAGWDTHGLPVELSVEKQLGISGKQEIEKYGVENFVQKCKDSVFEYEREWRKLTEAIGYWTDMDHPYVTLKNSYIETVWHILSSIHQKGLLYKGHRVSPYCPCCQTTLSSHEVAQGYEVVKDLSAVVKFRSKDTRDIFLAWTTTPWTLPANSALAINKELSYSRVKQNEEVFVVATDLVEKVMRGDYEVISTHKGSEFIGVSYDAVFPYLTVSNGHVIIAADFVSNTSGTGIVHVAPAYGEDDSKAAQKNGIATLHTVDKTGRFTELIEPFHGRFVKECDIDIIKYLAHNGFLYHKEKFEHRYPFCWRCKSPLLYYAMESWFIETTAVRNKLIENNQTIEWYPDHLREGRFGNFLEDLVDWNISRNRYWGTPLNVWVCEECKTEFAPGSVKEMRNRAVHSVPADLDLHKPYVDEIHLRCEGCSGTMKRTPEVIDVWFDSGSMPFAQYHYPFENETTFHEQYPADMICEGIDQTRGWFFSLLAVSTLFNGNAPFKRVISTGHILDENGQKMSKSKGNVIDPWEIIEAYGADAFRWALLSDSAPWNSKRFSKQIVAEAKSKVIDTLTNAHAFFVLYATIDGYKPTKSSKLSQNEMDRWILSRLNSVVREVRDALDAYDFLNSSKVIEKFIDELSNWYIRRSRDRFWGKGLTEDKQDAYQTLHHVLVTTSKLISPFAPFIAEEMHNNLVDEQSIHLSDYPEVDEALMNTGLESEMQIVRQIVELARNVRNETNIKTRQPLAELVVVTNQRVEISKFIDIIKEEVNVKEVRLVTNDQHLISVSLKLNYKVAGPIYGKNMGEIQRYLLDLSSEEAKDLLQEESFVFTASDGKAITVDRQVILTEKTPREGYAASANQLMTVVLNTAITPELKREGIAREVIRVIQDYRKRLDLPVEKRVDVLLSADDEVREATKQFENILRESILMDSISYGDQEEMEVVSFGEKVVKLRFF